MALARVVTFDGVSRERMDEMNRRMESGEPPEGFPSSELIVLHDPEARALSRMTSALAAKAVATLAMRGA